MGGIGFIGAGRVGTAIGIYLMNNGINIAGYFSKSYPSSENASLLTKSTVFQDIYELAKEADILAITTPDDVIPIIVDDLKKRSSLLNNKVVLHMSGVHSSDLILSLDKNNENSITALSLHPLLSISNPINAAKDLSKANLIIEGRGQRLKEVKDIFEKIGNRCIEISTENKVKYHIACSVLANYLVTLIDIGINILMEAGFTKEEANFLAEPLTTGVLENIFKVGTEKALTGPISRGDLGTIIKHLESLKGNENWLGVYQVMGNNTIDIAKRAKTINQEKVRQLKEVLTNNE